MKLPIHIQSLRSYDPGPPPQEIAARMGLKDIAVLWNNENNLGVSPMAIKAIQKELGGLNQYPDALGKELCQALALEYGLAPEQVVMGNGSEGLMMNALKAWCTGEGDELLTSAGTFVIIYVWCKILNIPCIQVPLTPEYDYDLDQIVARIGPQTKVIYLANANNPTGRIIPEKAMKRFMEKVPQHVLVISDEAYYHFSRDLDPEFPETHKMGYPNLLTLRTFSKSFGLAGLRIGYGLGPTELIEPMKRVKLTFEPTAPAQAGALGALQDKEFLERSLENNRKALQQFQACFDRLNLRYIKGAANFIMLEWGSPEKCKEMYQALLQKGVFTRTLEAFGLPSCMRISTGRPEENQLFVQALDQVCSN